MLFMADAAGTSDADNVHDNPFASGTADAVNPFGGDAEPEAAANPFGAAADDDAENTTDNPFGADAGGVVDDNPFANDTADVNPFVRCLFGDSCLLLLATHADAPLYGVDASPARLCCCSLGERTCV